MGSFAHPDHKTSSKCEVKFMLTVRPKSFTLRCPTEIKMNVYTKKHEEIQKWLKR